MSAKGFNVPKSTPTGKRYREIEREFIKLARKARKSVAEYDLEIWNEYHVG
jgi:thermostable 8-oxoguanine DNA glycosylase